MFYSVENIGIIWVSSIRKTLPRAKCREFCGYFLGLFCRLKMFGKSATWHWWC